MRLSLVGAIGATLVTLLSTTSASAETGQGVRGVDWSRVITDVDALTRRGMDVLDVPRCSPAGCITETNTTAARPERGVRFDGPTTSNDWLGFKPTVSLVARDWGSSFRVAGDRLAVVDALRLTTSTRMVLARVRMTDARVAPFAQIGLGQWRTDPYLLPLTPRYEEIAAQAAVGVEVRVRRSWTVGLEQTGTVLHRQHGDSNLPSAHMWSATFASRVDF
jgi:hypothetical protein